MMYSASLSSLSSLPLYNGYSISKPKTPKFLQVRSQSLKDEGSSSNMVDANLDVLRARIEEVMKKNVKHTAPNRMKNIGWEYNSITSELETQHKNGRAAIITQSLEAVGLVTGSFGLVFLLGSIPIILVSLLVHL